MVWILPIIAYIHYHCNYVLCIIISIFILYIYLLQLWYFYLNISASRERSVFSHIVRFILYATCSARVASKINENCIVTGWEKFQRSNKSLITLVVQYGNDILLSRHIFTRLWLVKIFCVLVKYFPILYSDSCYKYYIYTHICIFIAALIFLLEYFRITRAFCILPYCTVYIVRSL